MKTLIATDGAMDLEKVGRAAAGFGDGEVTVLTVVEVPRSLLSDLRSVYGERSEPHISTDAEYVTIPPSEPGIGRGWPGDDEMIARYVTDQTERRTAALMAALAEAGVKATVRAVEGEHPVDVILDACADVDLLVIGARGRGRFEGLLGATSTKLSRRAPCSVLLIR